MTGFSKTEAVGKDLVEGFITNEFKDSVREVLDKALLGEETSNYEFPLFTKSGERIHLLLNATSRRAKDQTILGVIGIGQDISGRLEEEENLRHRERLEAVGSLTGGIAHDFNNLLTVVTGNLSMLGPRAGEEQEILDDAIKAARDGSNLVRDLLAFSRRQSLVPETCSMDAVLKHFQRSLGRALGEAITLEVSIEEAGLAAFVDKARFEAALLNVCINARDAVKTNGRITLKVFSSSPNHGDAPLIRKIQGSNNDSVCVQISDNGSGIEPELLSKITDPYFTTKDIGKGSGLGLSSVVGFVDQSGGSFRIFSTVGFGTTVEIFLPRSSQALIAEQSRTSTHAVDSDTGKEKTTIMVVDDEPNVLRLASRWLNRAGYNVIEAKNGDEALASIELRNGDIDVLFSDIVMPGKLNGWALAEEVSDRYPGIGIQLATGYDQVSQQEKGRVTKKRFPVLSKPYSLTDLSDSVRRLRLVSEKPRRARPSAVAATNTIPGS
jgi:PAS domain S-box-containing protein